MNETNHLLREVKDDGVDYEKPVPQSVKVDVTVKVQTNDEVKEWPVESEKPSKQLLVE